MEQTVNNAYNELHASFIAETAGNASVNHISSASPLQINASFN
jgi:hypothetical protein